MSPHPHEERDTVRVGGLRIEGWVAKACCVSCRAPLVHYVVFDALFCPGCNQWTTVLCDDPGCLYCRVRPDRPIADAA